MFPSVKNIIETILNKIVFLKIKTLLSQNVFLKMFNYSEYKIIFA